MDSISLLINNFKPKIVFLQEIWLPYSKQHIVNNFHPNYLFTIATPDMFQHPEMFLSTLAMSGMVLQQGY